jgi:hypothetical protein
MSSPDFPDMIRRRRAELEAEPPLSRVRNMLHGSFADAESLEEVRAFYGSLTSHNPLRITLDLRALDAILADPDVEGQFVELVEVYGNWVLDDPSPAGARQFLEDIARMLREVIAEHVPPPSNG